MPTKVSYNLRITSSSGFPQSYNNTDALSALTIIDSLRLPFYEIYRINGKILEKIDIATLEHEASLL